tara:strand:+ start:522 stop:701 length:180 start_codon:yes stop_codon:yes gene_type:complete
LILASKRKYNERLDICRACEFKVNYINKKRVKVIGCKKCGCIMNVKAKIDRMKCPAGKW